MKRGSLVPGKIIKVPITERALLQRINRALAKEHEGIRRCRETSRSYPTLGDFYRVDFRLNAVIEHDVDLVATAKKLEVLKPYEKLAADEEDRHAKH